MSSISLQLGVTEDKPPDKLFSKCAQICDLPRRSYSRTVLIKFTFLDICEVDTHVFALCRVFVGDIALKQFFKPPLFKHT